MSHSDLSGQIRLTFCQGASIPVNSESAMIFLQSVPCSVGAVNSINSAADISFLGAFSEERHMAINWYQATLAIGALGTAATVLVDTTKVFAGGMSRGGFGYIKQLIART